MTFQKMIIRQNLFHLGINLYIIFMYKGNPVIYINDKDSLFLDTWTYWRYLPPPPISSFFIKRVCDQNPDITFLYYTINADVFFTGINNLKFIQEIDSCPIDRNYTCDFENGESPEDRSNRKWLDFLLGKCWSS